MIERNWQELIRPEKPQIELGSDSQRKARLVAEPLERGFGVTLGNALRRVLLSSLQGAAVTAIQIDGVVHEFSSLEGVREDVVDIVLNIKQLALRMHAEGPKRMTLKATGPGAVTAGQIDVPSDIEVLNPDHVICTLDDGATVRMELTVQNGKGYVASEFNRPEDAPIGLIAVDALYSPVKKVAYRVEPTRQGQSLDYDKLVLEVETNGAVSPVDAVAYASRILQDQLQIFITFEEPKKAVEAADGKPDLPFNPALLKKVDELELSVRSAN
ncbi:MAG: DNA-directed RNA polymerase subunit alpha, partial [Brevundimonas sp.]